jgi:hypothetical protein
MTHLHLVKCGTVDLYDCLSRANALRAPRHSGSAPNPNLRWVSAIRRVSTFALVLARSTAMRFSVSRALIALGSDGGPVSRRRVAPAVIGEGTRGVRGRLRAAARKPRVLDPLRVLSFAVMLLCALYALKLAVIG